MHSNSDVFPKATGLGRGNCLEQRGLLTFLARNALVMLAAVTLLLLLLQV